MLNIKFNPPSCFSVKFPSAGRCQYKGICNINSLQPNEPYVYGSRSELFNFAVQPIKGSHAVCRSLEEFCSHLSNILWRFVML